MNNNKTVLILHGWPQPVEENSVNNIYLHYFKNKGYEVIAPKLFTKEFNLTPQETKNYIENKLNGKKPDLIVGISLGGLLAPVVASDYPNSKMVLIATAPKMSPDSSGLKTILNLAKNKNYIQILNLVKFLPQKVVFNLYQLINPFTGSPEEKRVYLSDMRKNVKYMLDIPVSEQAEIVNLVATTDNTELLKKLDNKTLIFSSKNDLMMPLDNSNGLHNLLKRNILVETEGDHFQVFSEKNFSDLDTFLD